MKEEGMKLLTFLRQNTGENIDYDQKVFILSDSYYMRFLLIDL